MDGGSFGLLSANTCNSVGLPKGDLRRRLRKVCPMLAWTLELKITWTGNPTCSAFEAT